MLRTQVHHAAGSEIWACPNVDSRASAEVAELVASGAAEQIYRRGGDWVSITSPARFLWIRRHQPEVWERIAHVGMLSDWVLTRLSGEYVTDATCGSSSDLFDLERRTWSLDSLALLGLDPGVLPPVLEPGTVVGSVTDASAVRTGLRAGTPVVAGGADTQLGRRNIFQSDSPIAMLQAVRRVVHENLPPRQALEFYETLRHEDERVPAGV
jgi:autoinducer 2 (AI-2) kinase